VLKLNHGKKRNRIFERKGKEILFKWEGSFQKRRLWPLCFQFGTILSGTNFKWKA
jgi:hypothetical protein